MRLLRGILSRRTFLRDAGGLQPGDLVQVQVEDSDEHDLYGVPA